MKGRGASRWIHNTDFYAWHPPIVVLPINHNPHTSSSHTHPFHRSTQCKLLLQAKSIERLIDLPTLSHVSWKISNRSDTVLRHLSISNWSLRLSAIFHHPSRLIHPPCRCRVCGFDLEAAKIFFGLDYLTIVISFKLSEWSSESLITWNTACRC